ncbi:SusC/RagA family TonB-linked outer membrane protein [uncultured Fibrella sp.]|uniref:SusC/RagA family TonB-linked outer membrane protein n=1 Tax=uncultured Fibrella sp. TaxID=1284596 RepID=UPI0035C96B82
MKKRILLTLLSLVCCWSVSWAQRTVTGKVTDQSNGQSLPGVSVTIKGTQRGTVTSAEGTYSLSADNAAILVFSFIGYTPAEVPVGTRETVNLALEPSSRNLDEVVVVGYGTQKRATLTGAVTQLRREDLVVRQVATASNLLQGLAPGVTVTQQSGRPGADGANVTIRGIGSLYSGTTPLLVIDGVQQPPNTLETLNNIDPNNIESISLLKDAASTAIYGARAANGVIVVRTRRGTTEGVQIDYNGFVSGQQATRLPERISGLEHMLLNNQAAINSSATAPFSTTFIDAYRNNPADNFRYFDTDWLGGVLSNTGLMQNHNLNISGGSERIKFFMAGTYLNQQGLTQNTSFKRYDLRFNTDVKLTKNLTFQGDLIYTNSTEIQPGGSTAEFIIRQAIGSPATGAGKFCDGQYGDAAQSNFRNPIGQAESSGFNRFQRPNTILRANFTYRPFSFMDVEAQFSNNSRESIQKRYIKNYAVYRPNLTTNALDFVNNYPGQNSIADAIGRSRLNNYLIQANFYKTLGRNELKLLLGFQAEDFITESLGASRTDLPSDQPYQTVGTANQSNSSSTAEYALAAGFGRFNYTFDDKYLLEVNGRYDGSSRFSQAQDRQWGFFPSVSAGWVITKEAFMTGLANAVTFAKLRGSYGKLGNQNLPDAFYPFAANFAQGQNYYFNNRLNFGVGQTNAVNDQITWETSTQANVGLDLTLFKNLSVTLDVYQRTISNLLLVKPIPSFTGFSPAYVNAGSMRNNGWELSLSYRNQTAKGLRYSVTGMLSDVKNQVLDLAGQDIIDGRSISTPGSPLRSYYGYLADGLYQSKEQVDADNALDGNAATPYIAANTAAGDIRYKDISGPNGTPDGKIDGFDRTILGNPFPRYSYSLTTNVAWKGFDLNVFFQGVGQRDSYVSGTGAWAFYSADFISSAFAIHRDAWTPTNPNATYPRLTTDQGTFNWKDSNYWVRNAAYLRLKNVQLGYTLPASISNKLKIRSARLYVSGQNLATFTSFLQGFDPEKEDQNGEFYPVMRTTTVGLNLRF